MSLRAVPFSPSIPASRVKRKHRPYYCSNRDYYRAPLSERFWSKVARKSDNECWPWLASTRDGYGQIGINKRVVGAHRIAYELTYGPIPVGLVIDHLCENRGCQNPLHLEAVTQATNIRRSFELQERKARKASVPGWVTEILNNSPKIVCFKPAK